MQLVKLEANSFNFPDPETALQEPNGLLALGGDLTLPRLLSAYHQGVFPWFDPGEMILWWSPDPRAVLFPSERHVSRSLRRFMRQEPYRFTLNRAFSDVVNACAQQREEGTWIGPLVKRGYQELHDAGHAHSVEVWSGDALVGGMYGVNVGGLFCGESMFTRQINASKCAVMIFCQHFTRYGGELIDCQVLNPHTASLGAREIPRRQFLQLLSRLSQHQLPPECWLPQDLSPRYEDLPIVPKDRE
ncbi:leucyl/phenylalanyl-tRNA--protein transferase [Ewingella americana]|jgi:leucyl/phenylalanyl-tRNA--protein transferase|uniref:Leucyl/phenylalanyl-tRNA--protein transferase n=1 Tax=Ewingella americana TaxID=41202 RepID=A0A502GT87_9GAMM|nr:leucyl/phenylalanyl-tRNA--protein transferase [Ewingella americana]TPG65131.1 leucyl/phenylalanyl-tRNA--protein transferase [Ewingella americana]